jgi:carbon storage regulator CsrA
MLVLTRRIGEVLQIGDDVCIKVVSVDGRRVRLAIDAPVSVNIRRGELSPRQDADAAPREHAIGLGPSTATVLFVDNDARIRQFCKEEFEGEGLRALVTSDGEQALSMLATNAIDVVVLDEHMPGWSGLETAARIRQLDPSVRIILFTGDSNERLSQTPQIDEIVPKAADPIELKAAVARALQHTSRANRAATRGRHAPACSDF